MDSRPVDKKPPFVGVAWIARTYTTQAAENIGDARRFLDRFGGIPGRETRVARARAELREAEHRVRSALAEIDALLDESGLGDDERGGGA